MDFNVNDVLDGLQEVEYNECAHCGGETLETLCDICKAAYSQVLSIRDWFKRAKEDHTKLAMHFGVGRRHASCTFDNYSGDVASWDFKENLLIQSPKAGNGKTHLAVAFLKEWVNSRAKECRRPTVLFTSFTELMRDLRATFDDSTLSEAEAIKQLCSFDLLVIDDIGAEKVTDFVQATIYTVLNRRYEDCLPTIATSNLDAKEMSEQYGSRMVSRLASGTVIKVSGSDDRVKKTHTREVPEGKTLRITIGRAVNEVSKRCSFTAADEDKAASKMYSEGFTCESV